MAKFIGTVEFYMTGALKPGETEPELKDTPAAVITQDGIEILCVRKNSDEACGYSWLAAQARGIDGEALAVIPTPEIEPGQVEVLYRHWLDHKDDE